MVGVAIINLVEGLIADKALFLCALLGTSWKFLHWQQMVE
jgi:hypothetical protein